MTSQHTSGAQIVLDALVAEGVDVAFGYPGGTIMPVHDALFTDHRIRHVLVRHEQGAAFAAGGYARTTGKVGVCIATSGPGATNLVTGICDAMMDSVPIVAITGQVRSPLMGTDGFQEADVAAITSTITKRNIIVRDIDSIPAAIHAAFELARGPRPGPVLVDIPTDVLRTKIEAHVAPNSATNGHAASVHTNGESDLDDVSVERAVELICESKRPLVIVGGGARISNAVESYREFMRLLNAPHTATINGLGTAEPQDPSFLGMCGMHGWKAANKAVGECDLILALGMRFDDRVTGRTDRFARQAKIIHADIDASEFNKIIAVDVALHGDLDAILRELTGRLSDRMIPDFLLGASASRSCMRRSRRTGSRATSSWRPRCSMRSSSWHRPTSSSPSTLASIRCGPRSAPARRIRVTSSRRPAWARWASVCPPRSARRWPIRRSRSSRSSETAACR